MARTAAIEKMKRRQKFIGRYRNRCMVCGRSRGYYRKFGLCRICFRSMAHRGEVPGVTKSSW